MADISNPLPKQKDMADTHCMSLQNAVLLSYKTQSKMVV